jgi:hypothetical protein
MAGIRDVDFKKFKDETKEVDEKRASGEIPEHIALIAYADAMEEYARELRREAAKMIN